MKAQLRRWAIGIIGWWGLVVGLAVSAENAAVENRMRQDLTFLASDECEGRGVGTKGIDKAADYIAEQFRRAGLKPAGADGTYFQPFTMNGPAEIDGPNWLTLHGPLGQTIELAVDTHFRPMGLSGSGTVTAAPLVFVGYGITAPESNYDDYKGIDVAGKIVVVLRKAPRFGNPHAPFSDQAAQHAGLERKMVYANLHKPAAILFVNDRDTARTGDVLMDFRYTAAGGGGGQLPAMHVRREVIDSLLQSTLGTTLQHLEEDIDRDLKPRSAVLTGWTADIRTSVKRTKIAVKNVVGVLEGAGPLAKETVILGAHYDHLGYGGRASLARDKKAAIHYGADDNASGTTMLLELARRLGADEKREGRRLVFIAFSAEESGLLGSEYYTRHPIFPLADTVAMINMDMVGRLRPDRKEANKDELIVYGTGTAKTFDELIERVNKKHEFKLKKVPGGMGPSDHASFYIQKVPVLFFFTGEHTDYHRPSDTADKINVAGMRRIADLVEEVARELATVRERPQYVKVAGGGRDGVVSNIPRIGIRPSYSDTDPGVLLAGVLEGGPA
ncbi:MAG: M28 family peptidase, partial [Gemmataceae bacterium]|nr:M28 family peptidase [Gemmataceae bacterium]MDW8264357.1 M28 family peptidase [Gemmataceae bacterium]